MALWQIRFFILPNKHINVSRFDKNDFDDGIFWEKVNFKKDFFVIFSNILNLNKSWSNDIDLYGQQDGNCIEIYKDKNDKVQSVSFRIDFRSDYIKILDYIINFCTSCDFCIISNDLIKIPLNSKKFVEYINNTQNIKKYQILQNLDKN